MCNYKFEVFPILYIFDVRFFIKIEQVSITVITYVSIFSPIGCNVRNVLIQ